VVVLGEQPVAQVGADESGGSRDKVAQKQYLQYLILPFAARMLHSL
jgi:hypothetical protein